MIFGLFIVFKILPINCHSPLVWQYFPLPVNARDARGRISGSYNSGGTGVSPVSSLIGSERPGRPCHYVSANAPCQGRCRSEGCQPPSRRDWNSLRLGGCAEPVSDCRLPTADC